MSNGAQSIKLLHHWHEDRLNQKSLRPASMSYRYTMPLGAKAKWTFLEGGWQEVVAKREDSQLMSHQEVRIFCGMDECCC